MDRFRQKNKKEKPSKHVDNSNTNSFIADVKSIKENLKIKEILRTVKMNSSMRVKAPRGSKVMNSKDFNDNEDLFDDALNIEPDEQRLEEPHCATNHNILVQELEDFQPNSEDSKTDEINTAEIDICDKSNENADVLDNNAQIQNNEQAGTSNFQNMEIKITGGETSNEMKFDEEPPCKIRDDDTVSAPVNADVKFPLDNPHFKNRDRKLSLDHSMLSRREGLSQSELDLNSIGKSPLERKSSFFRKKMDSFLKNTTEIFRKQSLSNKCQPVQRRGSMSVSLQSLNEMPGDYGAMLKNTQGSAASLQSSSTIGYSASSLSAGGPPGASDASLAGSQPALYASAPLVETSAESTPSLNETYNQQSLLNTRAISMSSGLDSSNSTRRRKSSNRSNRVTWLASEGLTNYFKRMIMDETTTEGERQLCHSYSDFITIPENELCGPRLDSKGRRLSYQRAVSGEDPVMPPRYENSLRRRLIPEYSEANYDLTNLLAEFTRNGVPPLHGFAIANISDEAFAYLYWAGRSQTLEEFYEAKMTRSNGKIYIWSYTNTKGEVLRRQYLDIENDEIPPSISERQLEIIEKILLWEQKIYKTNRLNISEETRQAMIRELVTTEAVHIRHLISIVEVFIAAAHALQDAGKLLEVETERLFSNIPDVLNASLIFWEMTIYPMLVDAVENSTTLNTEYMAPGFCRFREVFSPYEKFVSEQSKVNDYLRSLQNNSDFMMYLNWCHSQRECNRLQLADILVKPMQRLTKYGLILRRIIGQTDTEPERTSLIAMDNFAKNYVLDLNRTIRQREELEKLDVVVSSVEGYEIEFKDDDLDRYFKMFAQLNLKAPMVNCLPSHSRSVIHEGDVRYKDQHKEMEVKAFLLTDMLLICKKQSKGSLHPYKMIRPKYMVDKMIFFPKYHPKNTKELISLTFVVVDEVGSSANGFTLTETTKDASSQTSLRLWELKLKEARLTYDLGVWFAKNPSRDLSEVEMDSSSEYALSSGNKPGLKQSTEELNIEREARERVATMLHRVMGTSTECDFSQASLTTDSFDGNYYAGGEVSGASGARAPGLPNFRHPMHRNSTGGSSRNSRLSSFQQSTSATSHDEPQAGPSKNMYQAGSSVEHLIPPLNPEDTVTSITVNVVSESESETVVPTPQTQAQKLGSRSGGSTNTLRVQAPGGVLALVHSLPDLTVDPSPAPRTSHRPLVRNTSRAKTTKVNQSYKTVRVQPQSGVMALVLSMPDLTELSLPHPSASPGPQSASEKLYQSHQELLQRNRLTAGYHHHQFLTPDHRGTSYPPPSPTRASLKRGLAFSYSLKNPPLSKMGHVNSQSQLPAEAATAAVAAATHATKADRSTSSMLAPSTSTDKGEKKSKQFISRHKGGSSRGPSTSRKDDKTD